MLEILDRDNVRTAYLENANGVNEDEPINDIGKLQFKLPRTDPKNDYCKPFHRVRWLSSKGEKGELYRIIKPETIKSNVKERTYLCEHVLATLADSVMPGYHIIGNIGTYTADVIRYVLSFQKTKNWVLDECDFSRQFEYAWTNETVLNALWSIPNRFTEPYIWKVNTATYPWRISLKRIDTNAEPRYFIRGGHNLLSMQVPENAQGIITRIYPLGYGEGDNQLTIKSVNNGVEYLQSPKSIVDEYGIIERYLIDRRFEDAQSLKERAQAVLDAMQEPQKSATVNVSDIYQRSHDDSDKIENGRIVMIVDDENPEDGIKSYITSISRNRDAKGEARVTIANKPTDIASSLADLADRQRIETVYSQGATQIYAQSVQANASTDKGAILRFYIPADMRIVNFVNAKITLDRFRSYSKATGGGGATTATSDSGGGSTATSSSGGGTSTSTQSGGGTATSTSSGGGTATSTSSGGGATTTSGSSSASTSDSAGSYSDSYATGGARSSGSFFAQTGKQDDHTHGVPNHTHALAISIGSHRHGMAHTHSVSVPSHSHSFSVPDHSHGFSVPAHSHSFTINAHTHSVTIPAHNHRLTLPDHTHTITQGIFEFGSPTGADIYVNGAKKASMQKDAELDISTYLLNDNKTIPRGSWLSVEVRPNDLAYVTIDLVIKGFCQSRGGSTY